MDSLGTKLREERERQGLSLDEISTKTRIRRNYLEAIEQDKLETIPGGFFTRSFARQYATALGVAAVDLKPLLDAVTSPPADAVQIERLLAEYRPSPAFRAGGDKPDADEEEEHEYLNEARYLKEPRSGVWMALAVLLICGSVAYLTWQRKPELFEKVFAKGQTTGSPARPSLPADPAPAPPVSQAPAAAPDPAVPDSNPTAKSEEPSLAAPSDPAPPVSDPVTITIRAKELVWLRLFSDGKKIFGGTMNADETRTLTGAETAMVFTGNAGGLELSHNGKSIGALGPRGMVRTVVFTPDNYEIRSTPVKQTDATEPLASSAAARER